MDVQTVTLELPNALYERVMQRADFDNRKVAEVLVKLVEKALPEDELPLALQQELEAMRSYSDKALWKIARSRMPTNILKQLDTLNYKQKKKGEASLTSDEKELLEKMLYEHDKFILIKSEAAVLLMRRGYDISSLGPKR
jgi:hypothetical protein